MGGGGGGGRVKYEGEAYGVIFSAVVGCQMVSPAKKKQASTKMNISLLDWFVLNFDFIF